MHVQNFQKKNLNTSSIRFHFYPQQNLHIKDFQKKFLNIIFIFIIVQFQYSVHNSDISCTRAQRMKTAIGVAMVAMIKSLSDANCIAPQLSGALAKLNTDSISVRESNTGSPLDSFIFFNINRARFPVHTNSGL